MDFNLTVNIERVFNEDDLLFDEAMHSYKHHIDQ